MKKLLRKYWKQYKIHQEKQFDTEMREFYKKELEDAPKTFSDWLSHCITPFPAREVID